VSRGEGGAPRQNPHRPDPTAPEEKMTREQAGNAFTAADLNTLEPPAPHSNADSL